MLVHNLSTFIDEASYKYLTPDAKKQLKIRLLDSLGTAIGAVEGQPVQAIRNMVGDFGGTEMSTLIGGGKITPERAARNTAARNLGHQEPLGKGAYV